ncbi:cation channel sperm-associated protein subunit delta [Arvicola amphibius]|uniref:cation channel sperm-associated protein subunit delta n=1 Tax=Arvicola amphibius TaxID=1047088 RepID=UPI001C0A5BAB|nr:cation channel sperm-associated protein subunit delta [Arvicola amphibius]
MSAPSNASESTLEKMMGIKETPYGVYFLGAKVSHLFFGTASHVAQTSLKLLILWPGLQRAETAARAMPHLPYSIGGHFVSMPLGKKSRQTQKKIFLTMDNFESSLPPLIIPRQFSMGTPLVTSAFFAPGTIILFVVNRRVFIYNYHTETWSGVHGVNSPVSHISGDSCCFSNQFCLELANSIFVYFRGGSLPRTRIYFSDNGGFSFQDLNSDVLQRFSGVLGGIFYLHSMSQVGILVVKGKIGLPPQGCSWRSAPLTHYWGSSMRKAELGPERFGLAAQLSVVSSAWCCMSARLEEAVGLLLQGLEQQAAHTRTGMLSPSFSCFVILTSRAPRLLYPRYWAQSAKCSVRKREDRVHLPEPTYNAIRMACSGMPEHGDVEAGGSPGPVGISLVMPVRDSASAKNKGIGTRHDVSHIRGHKAQPDLCGKSLPVPGTRVPLASPRDLYFLSSSAHMTDTSHRNLHVGGQLSPLHLSALESWLSLHDVTEQAGLSQTHTSGNPRDEIELQQQHHWNNADLNFTSSIKHHSISSLTVDIADKTMACVDLKPLTTLISIGCDQTKRIVVQNKISACSMGILDAVELQKNYSYTIEKEAYKPVSHNAEAQSNLLVYYQYKALGCPRLVYYDKPWKPVVELWKDGVLEEIMNAEYVISEINGVFTYSYSLTAATANCRSQPQNWSTIRARLDKHTGHQSLWNRENYVSCHEDNDGQPLLWPEVEYQILGGRTDNKVIFGQRNGIYIFLLTVVDPYYSYCSLNTIFSVYVYGALPVAMFPPVLSIMLLVVTTLLSMWLVYTIPKELSTERGQRFKNFWSRLFLDCFKICNRFWLWGRLRQCLRSRKVKDQPKGLPSQVLESSQELHPDLPAAGRETL